MELGWSWRFAAIRDLMVAIVSKLRASLILTVLGIQFSGLSAQEVRYGTGAWDADVYGTHRVAVRVPAPADAVWVHVPWRRRDYQPENKEILVISASTGNRVQNVARVEVNREYGDLVFQPAGGSGEYWLYYLPYSGNVKSSYPVIKYRTPEQTAEPAWLVRNHLTEPKEARA